ncbi:cupin domain-containing protein [Sneathiella sp. HT1-7]|jgi:predicted cupin superfamily sugar epimerase|uniref:cupin domain-containing protein n=1 Tax=Sneathiella sp. HT1-7 TaxID=2887192 RepID=UPI001D151509|nr:cupin domain-containing protein [Sneathiella sp. HT1-7]MCC3304112.1 cupin domain-containing protein [Sneathiella sp. HT1-7]
MTLTAADIIQRLNMQPHPEGGHFVETFRDDLTLPDSKRALSTAIYYLLEKGDRSHWHRVDAVEIWHYYAGASLTLSMAAEDAPAEDWILGPDLFNEQRPQITIPRGYWQAAHSNGDWTLVGCTVAPGFEFDGFEMAPKDWAPTI